MLTTANPTADAERDETRKIRREQVDDAKIDRATRYFEQALACKSGDWFTDSVVVSKHGGLMSPDELLAEATWREVIHKSSRTMFAKLMTSESAKELRAEAARLLANQFPDAGDIAN